MLDVRSVDRSLSCDPGMHRVLNLLHSPQRSDSVLHSSGSTNVICLSSASLHTSAFPPPLSGKYPSERADEHQTENAFLTEKHQKADRLLQHFCRSKNTSAFVCDPHSGLDGKQPSREKQQ